MSGVINIEGWHEAIPAGRKVLLDAILSAGAPASYQCRTGECGSCKCRLIDGKVKKLPHLPDALSSKQEADGWILPCRCLALSDVKLVFPKPFTAPKPREMTCAAKIAWLSRETPEVIRLTLESLEPFTFLPGQYVSLRFPNLGERHYSPANLPGHSPLEFFIRIVPDGLISSHLENNAAVGEPLELHGPFGNACLDSPPQVPILLAAGGAGLAPILSMLRWLAQEAPQAEVWLFVGARSRSELIAEKELERMADRMPRLQILRILSENQAASCHSGFIGNIIPNFLSDLRGFDIYIAGPPPMVSHTSDAVIELGADISRIFADPFIAAKPKGSLARLGSYLHKWISV